MLVQSYGYCIIEVFQFSDLNDPETDDFQNLSSSYLFKDTLMLKRCQQMANVLNGVETLSEISVV